MLSLGLLWESNLNAIFIGDLLASLREIVEIRSAQLHYSHTEELVSSSLRPPPEVTSWRWEAGLF